MNELTAPAPATRGEKVKAAPAFVAANSEAPEYVKDTLALIMKGKGDDVPVSQMPLDGTFPSATTQWEKRNIALEVPEWDSEVCIQCGKCAMVCPHATIRIKAYDEELTKNAPETFKWTKARGKEYDGLAYTIQVAVEDCTGCALCVEVCPSEALSLD